MRPTDVTGCRFDTLRKTATGLTYPSTLPAYADEGSLQPLRRAGAAEAAADWQRLWIDVGGEG